MKRYPGLKAFKNQELGRYPMVTTKSSRLAKVVLYSSKKEVATYDLDRTTSTEKIIEYLSAHGIEPTGKRRF